MSRHAAPRRWRPAPDAALVVVLTAGGLALAAALAFAAAVTGGVW